ncbi:MAG: LLM class flavin-dependent oxidoreductase [Sphingomonadales bacterium]|nr:LLM class flavin-dependent oxidoreductase [Sphingomonadales bacterium]
MKFGFLVSRKLIDRGAADPYGRVYRFIAEMEELGYDIAYVGHHRFADRTAFGGDTASEPSAPLTMVAAMLARTTRLKFCTNIMLLPSRHPVEIIEEVNTLNELSGNRFILGSGIGYKRDEFETTGWDFKTRAGRMEECLEIIRKGLAGEPFSYHGSHFTIDDLTVVPKPPPGPPMPLWIGAVSAPAMRRAGRLGDGWLISFAEHMVELESKVAEYKAIAAAHGRPATLALMRDLHIAPTRDQLDPQWLRNVTTVWQSYDNLGSKADRDAVSNEVIFGGKAVSLDEFVPNRAIVGTPDQCAAELRAIRDRIDPEYVMMTPTGVPDMDQHWRELRLFAREVMPAFRD